MIDLHTHVLPGIDDGPAGVEGSLELARVAAAGGVRTIAATPHITWDLPNTAATVADGVAALQPQLDAAGIDVRLVTGGEIAASRARELPDEELSALKLARGEWLLVECPLSVAAIGFDQVLYELQARGHRVVLAHPERSPALHRDPDKVEAFVDAGMLASITAGSLTGQFGQTVKRFTLELIERGLVHNLTSDAHDAQRRPPAMAQALEVLADELPGSEEHGRWWTEDVPDAIISGRPVPAAPGPPPQRKRRRRLFRRAG